MNVLITGASRGLGYSLAEAAAARGHTVFAAVRDIGRIDKLQELLLRFPGQVQVVSLDVTSEASIAETASTLGQDGVKLDAIVNNAAVLLGRAAPIEELDAEEMLTSWTVNLLGPMLVVKHFLPLLNRAPGSVIINISSEAGSFAGAYGGDYPYALSKAGLTYFTAQLRNYVQEARVRVYAVHPGWIQTDMGGASAPGSPSEAADGILDIMENKTAAADAVLIDHNGSAMPL